MRSLFFFLVCGLCATMTKAQVFCLKTVTNYPYVESFETNTIPNDWYNSASSSIPLDNLSWIRRSGATPTTGTGPNGAQSGSYYLYTSAASNPNYNNYGGAILYSPCFNLASAVRPAITFNYHMSGIHSEGLKLQASLNGGAWTTVWERSGDRDNAWRNVYVDLTQYNPTGFYLGSAPILQLRFVSSVRTGPLGDVALDNIRVYSQSPYSLCRTQGTSYSFEDFIAGWTQSNTDDIDWEETPVRNSSNNNSGYSPDGSLDYLNISSGSANVIHQAVLTSECINLSNFFSPKMSFYYKLDNGGGIGLPGNLKLEISTNGGTTWTQLFSRSWHTNDTWIKKDLNLSSYTNNTVRLRFTGSIYAFSGQPGRNSVSLEGVSIFNGLFFRESEAGTDASSLTQVKEAATLSVAPNPFQEQFTVQTTLPDVRGYRLTNLQGVTVQEGDLQQVNISVGDLPSGLYFMTVYNAEQQLTQKILKR